MWGSSLGLCRAHCLMLPALAATPLESHCGLLIQVSKTTSVGIEDLYFVTTVTMENVGDNTLYDVQYLRNVDPDPEQVILAHHDVRAVAAVAAVLAGV